MHGVLQGGTDGGTSIRLRPSRQRRLLLRCGPPLAALWLLTQAAAGADPFPLLFAPLLLAAALQLHAERAPRELALRGAGLFVLDARERWRPVRVLPGARVSALAVELPVEDAGGHRCRLAIWRDAVSDADFRRLARRVRSGRWPGDGAFEDARRARAAATGAALSPGVPGRRAATPDPR